MTSLRTKFKMWRLVRRIMWIGNHILGNGWMLEVQRENDEILHAKIKKIDEEEK